MEKFLELERQVGNNNMTNYQIGDFLIRLKNASMANIKEVVFPKTKLVLEVAKILKIEKFLDSVEEKDENVIVKLSIFSKKPVLSNVTIISKPGLRIYMSADELEKIKTPDVYILTTPKGVLSGKMAMKLRVGGEVIAKII